MPKRKTRTQVIAMRDKAVRFLRDVVDDPDRADDFEAMSPDEYAEHKRIQIENPQHGKGRLHMARQRLSREEMRDRIDELEQENETLNEKLESILGIVSDEGLDDDDDAGDDR